MLVQQTDVDRSYQQALMASFSHEQMTPLNNILSNAKLLLDRHQRGQLAAAKNVQEMIEGIMFSADIMQMHTNSILQMIKCVAGPKEKEKGCVRDYQLKVTEVLRPFGPIN
jgi:K+-sensing histidine kinase KdpD